VEETYRTRSGFWLLDFPGMTADFYGRDGLAGCFITANPQPEARLVRPGGLKRIQYLSR